MIIYSPDLLASLWRVLSEVHAIANEWPEVGKNDSPLSEDH